SRYFASEPVISGPAAVQRTWVRHMTPPIKRIQNSRGPLWCALSHMGPDRRDRFMLFVVRFFPEITIKSRPVRHRFIRMLRRSLRLELSLIDPEVTVRGDWDNLEIVTRLEAAPELQRVVDCLAHTPGIAWSMQVRK